MKKKEIKLVCNNRTGATLLAKQCLRLSDKTLKLKNVRIGHSMILGGGKTKYLSVRIWADTCFRDSAFFEVFIDKKRFNVKYDTLTKKFLYI